MVLQKKSKRVLVLMLVFSMLLSMLSGCQSNDAKSNGDTTTTTVAATTTSEESAAKETTAEQTTTEAPKAKITVTDGDGKTWTFDEPIKTAVVFDRYNTEVFRAVGAYDVMVGVNKGAVDSYPEYWPGIGDTIQYVGQKCCSDYDVELIAQMKPDAVFCSSLGEYEAMRDQLANFDIPVIVINAWIPSEYYDYIDLVGKVTGKEERANEFIAFCKDAMKAVNDGLATIPEDQRKTVYFENNGEYKTSLVGSGWHDMLVSAGGINIFGDIVFTDADKSKGSTHSYLVDPEAILEADPDVLIDNIYSTKIHNQLEATVKLEENELKNELKDFVNRPGWSNLKAVKNNEVYGFTSFLGNANSKLIAIMYISKWLYPETFTDLDPDAYLAQWCNYMGFEGIENLDATLK